MLFSFSFAALSATIAWVMTFLPRRPQVGWPLATVFTIASVGETALIAMQAWRGKASHFNDHTPFDESVFIAMGFLIAGVATVMVILTIWSFVSLRAPRSLAWSIKLGLLLLVSGLAIGGIILAEGQMQSDLGPPDSPVRFGEAGVMNVPHALAIHALQVVPILGWILLFTRWEEGRRLALVLFAAAGYAAVIVATIAQAAAGRAPLDPSAATGAVTLAGAGIVALAYLVALLGLSGGGVRGLEAGGGPHVSRPPPGSQHELPADPSMDSSPSP
jgi:hypothetical protein